MALPPRDVAALASRIGRALALSPSERDAIGLRARAHVAGKFMLERMQGSTLAVYDELSAAIWPSGSSVSHQQSLAPEVQTTGDTTPFQQSV